MKILCVLAITALLALPMLAQQDPYASTPDGKLSMIDKNVPLTPTQKIAILAMYRADANKAETSELRQAEDAQIAAQLTDAQKLQYADYQERLKKSKAAQQAWQTQPRVK